MKKIFLLSFLSSFIFLLANPVYVNDAVTLTQEEQEYINNTKFNIYVTNWEPFTIHFENHIDGISAGMWEEIISKSNINYKYIKDEDFAQALKLIKKDKYGMIIATSSTKEREEYASFSKPFISFPVSIATNVDKDFILDLSELNGKKVAVGENYTAYFLLKKHFPKIDLVPTKDTIEALDLLANGKVYAAADILPVLIYNMNKYNFTDLKISGTSKFNFDVKFMVNKHSQEIIPILNKLIGTVSDEDKQKILNKWVFTKQITKVDYTYVYIISIISILVISFIMYRHKLLQEKEKQLQDSEFRWKFAIEGSGDGLWDWDLKTNKVYFSTQWKKMLGYEDNEISDSLDEWKKRVNPNHLRDIQNDLDNYIIGFTNLYKNEHQMLCKDGTYKWILDRGIIVQRDKDGNPARIIGTHTDIDDIKTFQKLVADQKEEFESIFRYSKDGIAILDKNTKFLKFNDAFLKLTGFTKKELLSKTSKELTAPEDLKFTNHIVENILKNEEAATYEKTFIFKDDKRVSLNVSLSLLPDKERLLIVAKDVTSLRILENQSKLAAMGEMIGNIAHQWRQPLSIISTSASGMKLQLQFDKDFDINSINNTADIIVQQTTYLSKTIDDFRNFIKGDNSQQNIKVRDVINSAISLVDAVLKDNYINVIIDLEDDIIIKGNRNELQQAIINIINNAKDAIKENIIENNDKLLFISTKKIDDKALVLKIVDSAGGIDEEIIKRIFEPYFTTKHQSVGTGLGLSMVDKIIRERHTFNISVHNEKFTYEHKEYKGACFSIVFFQS